MKDSIIELISTALLTENNIVEVYGFGSFFRSNTFNDIDIAIVTNSTKDNLLETYYSTEKIMEKVSLNIGIKIDFLLFTKEEFEQKPLLESDRMTTILRK